ncbi:MAG: hypothetical protein ABSH41_26205 [Syntrophobacteraceae bacterium]
MKFESYVKQLMVLVVCMVMVMILPGCVANKAVAPAGATVVQKAETDLSNIDWAAVGKYWADFTDGLSVAAQLTETVAGNVDVGGGVKLGQVVQTTVDPLIAKANDSVGAVMTVAAGLQAGTATVAQAQAALLQVKADVESANAAVGSVVAKTPTPAKAAITSVPPKATPAGSSK